MKAYKGFNEHLTSVFGNGQAETCVFHPGETKEVPASKTHREGFHSYENPFDCLNYYRWSDGGRFFIVEAEGDIDEDESGRIACTRITLVEELTKVSFAMEGMRYMLMHPDRGNWQQNHNDLKVAANEAEATHKDQIAIARGGNPMVKGPLGSILGLIVENDAGISACKLFIVNRQQAGKWLRLNAFRELEVAV